MIPVHYSVMANEVISYLAPDKSGSPLIIDGTLGEGGHSLRFLRELPECRVIGIDADEVMAQRASERLSEFSERFEAHVGWANEFLSGWDGPAPDAVLMDLGISSFHYEGRKRGFSFRKNEKLDMRLSSECDETAADLVNSLNEEDLANLIYKYGEERNSRRIARRIVQERKGNPILYSDQLADIVVSALPPKMRHMRIHGATRTFQALRIAVNRELERLQNLLNNVPDMLAPEGRLGIISFHSLEDGMVKRRFRELDVRFGGSFQVFTRKPLMPSEEECLSNPPSRSARFRVTGKPGEQDV